MLQPVITNHARYAENLVRKNEGNLTDEWLVKEIQLRIKAQRLQTEI